MHRQISAFVVRIWQKQVFSLHGSFHRLSLKDILEFHQLTSQFPLKFMWLFFILIFVTNCQSNLAIESQEFSQPVMVGYFKFKGKL